MARVAVGCPDYAALASRISDRSERGEVRLTTRFRPKRANELIGGYLHFIVRHLIVGRVRILRFDDRPDSRVDIVCAGRLERVHPQPKRAHQGWRYMTASDAPRPAGDDSGIADLPPELYRELAQLSLI